MMPIFTSGVCARAAIGNSAAVAVAPSNTLRRVMVITGSSVDRRLIDETIADGGKALKNGRSCSLKHGKLLVAEIGHQHQSGRVRDRKRQLRRRDHRLRGHAAR